SATLFRVTLTPAAGAAQSQEVMMSERALDLAALAALAGGQTLTGSIVQVGDYGPSPARAFVIPVGLLA
ncbi:MAG: hypothetical protein RLZZ58_2164, partial [Pseudomonadota bacterium]